MSASSGKVTGHVMDILGIGLGPTQLLVILIVAFFVLGPERLPEVARQIARGIRTLRGYATDVQSQFGGEFEGLREEFSTIQQDLTSIQGNIRSGLLEIDSSLRSVHGDVQSAVAEVTAPPAAESETAPTEPVRPTLDYAPPATQHIAPPANPLLDSPSAAPAAGDRLPDYKPPA